jgi:hypothetical protein
MKLFQSMALATTMLMATSSTGYCDFSLMNGTDLLDECSSLETDGIAHCFGYILAIADVSACGSDVDLPLNFHPLAIRASGSCMPRWAV